MLRCNGGCLASVDTRYGLLEVVDSQTDLIGQFLDQFGEWAWAETRFVASVLPDAARVLDAGAFVGTFALGLAMNAKLAFLCSVEGNPLITPILRRNLERNIHIPTEVVGALLTGSGRNGHASHSSAQNLGGTTFSAEFGDGLDVDLVAGTTLAQLEERSGKFDCIKLDIEGAELEVLEANATRLSDGESILWVECNESDESLKVAKLLLSWGHGLWYFAYPSFNPKNFKTNPRALFPMAYEAGLMVSPRNSPAMDQELEEIGCILVEIKDLEDLKSSLWDTPRLAMDSWVMHRLRSSFRGWDIIGFHRPTRLF